VVGSRIYNGEMISSIAGHFDQTSIENPWSGARIDIDFTDWNHPRIIDVPPPTNGRIEVYAALEGKTTLERRKHWQALSPDAGKNRFEGPIEVGEIEWSKYKTMTAAIGSPVVYAMEPNGDLYWLRHDGFKDGSDHWTKSKERIGNGWTIFDKIVAGENGVIYGRLPDGRLRWHRHLGFADGSNAWTEVRIVREASEGWGRFKEIFAGSGGVLYGILPNGDLMWHKHDDPLIGGNTWESDKPRVGNGWQDMKAVFSPGNGIIYAIRPTGELEWFRHLGYETGERRWADGVVIDRGWVDVKQQFALIAKD
jgi:hypothetical protein